MKPKLNEHLIDKLSSIIRDGNYYVTACRACDISETAFYDWINRGTADLERGEETIFSKLVESLKKAEADHEAELLKLVSKAAPANWIAGMTILERRHPERWGRKDRQQIDITESKAVTITHVEYNLSSSSQAPVIEGESKGLLDGDDNREQT